MSICFIRVAINFLPPFSYVCKKNPPFFVLVMPGVRWWDVRLFAFYSLTESVSRNGRFRAVADVALLCLNVFFMLDVLTFRLEWCCEVICCRTKVLLTVIRPVVDVNVCML